MFINSTTYSGLQALEFYTDIVFGAPTIAQNKLRFITGVKDSIKIPALNGVSGLQADSCDQTEVGNIELTEKTISVCKMKINQSICIQDLETSFISESLRRGALNSDVPSDVLTYWMDIVTKQTMDEYEQILWQGDTTYVGPNTYLALCDGFLKAFAADPDVIPVAGVPLTALNIVTEMNKVYDAIPDVMMNRPDLCFYLPIKAKKFFTQAITSNVGQVNWLGISQSGDTQYFHDIPVCFSQGIPNDEMVCSFVDNLWAAVDLTNDPENVEVINFSKTTGADKVGLKGRFMSGVNYYSGGYVVYYS